MTTAELLAQTLVGKKLRHKNQWYREVVLEVEKVEAKQNTRDLEPATQANDWYPPSETTYWNEVTFVDGSIVKFDINANWDIVE